MIYTIIAILTACMAVFVTAATIQVIIAGGYAIGWVMLLCTLLVSWILFTDSLDSMME